MKVEVCSGKVCSAKFSKYITTRLENDKKFFGRDDIEVSERGCMGLCKESINISLDGDIHSRMNPSIASKQVFQK